ncbi:MAG: hypothetical protein JWL81_1502 [Verrucomicrobiales bacterium]|nr:hypothetical protein [Verrucomicrobiales bacterium]
MNFLAPLFLLGALAIAAPVIFHLIRRTTREKTRFSSLLFLKPDPPRPSSRSRVENWLLLLLRAAALALLALAFARPFFPATLPVGAASDTLRRVVILVDSSASMQRPGLTEAARAKAGEWLRNAAPGDQVAVWTFDSAVHPLMDFGQWTELPGGVRAETAAARLADSVIAGGGTGLANALTTAAGVLTEIPPGRAAAPGGEIIVISDFQEGSRTEGLQGWEWPRDVRVKLVSLTSDPVGNAGLQIAPESLISPAVEGSGNAVPPPARVRVWNSPDSPVQDFQVGWAAPGGIDFAGKSMDVTVPAGQSRVVELAWPNGPAAGGGAILLKGDAAVFDNLVTVTAPVVQEVDAWYFGDEALTDSRRPLYFLQQALPQSRRLKVNLLPVPPTAAVPVLTPSRPAVFFVTGNPPAPQAEFLKSQLAAGRSILYSLTTPAPAPALATLLGREKVDIGEVKPASYAMFSDIDFRHPLFAPFADPLYSDFTKIRFWRYFKLTPALLDGARTVAKFDSGDPAVLDIPVGPGRVMLWAAGWQPTDSQLALSSKFVLLLSSFLEWSGTTLTSPSQFLAGRPVPLAMPGLNAKAEVRVTAPDGSVGAVSGTPPLLQATQRTGLYSFTDGSITGYFAVNPDPAESRTQPMAADELERLGVPVWREKSSAADRGDGAGGLAGVQTESRQKLWRWIIVAALAVLLIETLLAGLSARRVPTPGGTVS